MHRYCACRTGDAQKIKAFVQTINGLKGGLRLMNEWKECKLCSITSKIGSGATPRGGENSYKTAGISLIRSQNVYNFIFSNDGLAYIDDKQAYELRNVEIFENDILINITGESVTRTCIVPKQFLPARVNQHVSIIRPIEEKADFKFIFYSLQSIKPELHTMAEIGCTRRALTKGMLENLDILLPPLPEQRAIASVLSSLDDKIDLLHRQNKTLEAMGETLFRQWFVEEVDKGWEEKLIGELFDISSGKVLKKKQFNNIGIYPVLGANGEIGRTDNFLYDEKLIYTGRVGTLGNIFIVNNEKVWLSDNTLVIRPLNYFYSVFFILKASHLEEYNVGSTQPLIRQSDLKKIEMKLPPKQRINDFEIEASAYFSKINNNQSQIRTLEKLRDTLLPKLMSGEVRVEYEMNN